MTNANGETVLIIEQAPHKWTVIGPHRPVFSQRSWSEADRIAKKDWCNAIFKSVDASGEVHIDDCTTASRSDIKELFSGIFGGQ